MKLKSVKNLTINSINLSKMEEEKDDVASCSPNAEQNLSNHTAVSQPGPSIRPCCRPSISKYREETSQNNGTENVACILIGVENSDHICSEWHHMKVSEDDMVSPQDGHLDKGNEQDANGVCIYKTPRSRSTATTPETMPDEPETTPKKACKIPIPELDWANSEDVWQNIVYKEEATVHTRNFRIFDNRSAYLPRMRAILLDWIMEVCEVYHLRRNTYYLAVDYIDRYLTVRPNVPKTQLQLLGVTCLLIASKFEEIYPPKVSEFSYICDGACTEKDILACEILLLHTLSWEVNPMTPTGWLNLYMQIHHTHLNNKLKDIQQFLYPQYSGYQFVRASHIMDLFTMDPGYLKFSYSVIAASAMYFTYGKATSLLVSGMKWKKLKPCVSYMMVLHHTVQKAVDPRLASVVPNVEDQRLSCTYRSLRRAIPKLITDENHTIQTHLIDLDYFEKSVLDRVTLYGIEISKIFVTKVKRHNNEIIYESTIDEDSVRGPSVVMYELTPPVENIRKRTKATVHPTDPEYEPGNVNIFTMPQKTVVTFDDILASIHKDSPYAKKLHEPKDSSVVYQ